MQGTVPVFAATLRSQREQAGFSSARSLFKRFGRQFLGCTYRSYLELEAGRSLPQPRLALRLALALAGDEGRVKTREFVSAYLRALIGRPDLGELMIGALTGALRTPAETSPLARATSKYFSGLTVGLTQRQAELITSSQERYWAFTVLTNQLASWTPAALARATSTAAPRVAKALAELAAAGLIEREPGGAFRCPRAGKVFVYPRDRLFTPLYREQLERLWEAKASAGGADLLRRHIVVRATSERMREYLPHLAQSVYGSAVYGVDERGKDTAFVTVTGSVRRLAPC